MKLRPKKITYGERHQKSEHETRLHGGMAWPQKKTSSNESRDTLSSTHNCHSQGLAGATKEHRSLLPCEGDNYRLFVR